VLDFTDEEVRRFADFYASVRTAWLPTITACAVDETALRSMLAIFWVDGYRAGRRNPSYPPREAS